jgi:hypothetical protein
MQSPQHLQSQQVYKPSGLPKEPRITGELLTFDAGAYGHFELPLKANNIEIMKKSIDNLLDNIKEELSKKPKENKEA